MNNIGIKKKVSAEIYQDAVDFLLYEAEILDDGRFEEWLDLMAEDFTYRIPVRVTRERAAKSEFSDLAYHMNETKSTMEMRVQRSYSQYNWAEDPISRTRHLLTNFRARMDEEKESEIHFKTNFLLYRNQFDSPTFQFLSGERHDTLRYEEGKWKLVKRLILLDHTTIPMKNLAIFI